MRCSWTGWLLLAAVAIGACDGGDSGRDAIADALTDAAPGDEVAATCLLTATSEPSTHVIGALRVCDSPMVCGNVWGCSPFGARSAYLYADGRLVSRTGTDWVEGVWFRERTLSAEQLCGVAKGVSLVSLARQSGLSLCDWTDMPNTEVMVEVGGVAHQASVYGDLFEADSLVADARSLAPDVVALAGQLNALIGGEPYVADAIELTVWRVTPDSESRVCTMAGAPEWPFADVDVGAVGDDPFDAMVLTLSGPQAADVRAWVLDLISTTRCTFVRVGADIVSVQAEDVPPGGREALPFGPCWGGQ